jgi:flagellar capping protein FliD
VEIGKYTSDTKLSDILSDINANTAAGVKVSYSQTSRQFTFTSKETGADTKINIDGGLAEEMFGSTELSDKSDCTFGEAYGVSWLDGEKVHFKIPGASGDYSVTVNKDDTIDDVAEKLNGMIFNHGYAASYNKYTGKLEIANEKSGEKVDVDMWADHPDPDFGRYELEFDEKYAPEVSYTPGQDAKFRVTVNGTEKELTRGSNSVEIDGLTINFKGTFNPTYNDPDVDKNHYRLRQDRGRREEHGGRLQRDDDGDPRRVCHHALPQQQRRLQGLRAPHRGAEDRHERERNQELRGAGQAGHPLRRFHPAQSL